MATKLQKISCITFGLCKLFAVLWLVFVFFFVGIALLGGTNLTAPINDYVDGHPTYKYASITDMIYKAVFHENAKQYKELLKLT